MADDITHPKMLKDYEPASLPQPFEADYTGLAQEGQRSDDVANETFSDRSTGESMGNPEREDPLEIPYTFYFVGSTITDPTIELDTMLANYDPDTQTDWSIEFAVTSGSFTGVITYSTNTDRQTWVNGEQTFYRIALIRDGDIVSSGGLYQEVTSCLEGEPVQQFNKVG